MKISYSGKVSKSKQSEFLILPDRLSISAVIIYVEKTLTDETVYPCNHVSISLSNFKTYEKVKSLDHYFTKKLNQESGQAECENKPEAITPNKEKRTLDHYFEKTETVTVNKQPRTAMEKWLKKADNRKCTKCDLNLTEIDNMKEHEDLHLAIELSKHDF